MSLEIKVQKKGEGIYVFSLLGTLDSNTYGDLKLRLKPLLAPTTKALIFDFAGLNYISSMGVSVLFEAKKNIEGQGGSFLMTNLQPQIKRVFEIINALPSVRIFETLEEADAYLTEMQKRALEEK